MATADTWRGNLADAAGNEMAVVLKMTPTGAPKPPPVPPPPPVTPPGVPANALWTQTTEAGSTTQTSWPNAGYNVNTGNWSAGAGEQTVWANSYEDWGVVATEVAGGTAVVTYPDVECAFYQSSNETGMTYPALTGLSALSSGYAEAMPATADDFIAEAAYDIWCGTIDVAANDYANAWSNEVMVWVDNHGQTPGGSLVETWTDATGRQWQIFANAANTYIAFVLQGAPAPAGTLDLLAMLNHLVGEQRLPAATVLTSVRFGWEICGTGGAPLAFACTGFSVAATAAA